MPSDLSAKSYDLIDQRGKDIVIYDGQCVFCTASIKTLKRLDTQQHLDFISLHDPSVASAYPDLSFDQLMEQMWVVSAAGKRFGGAYAVAYLSTRLPWLYPLAPFMHFPGTMPFWKWLYRWVARLRYRIAGKQCDNGSCSIHHR